MTVAELIETLRALPADVEVFVDDDFWLRPAEPTITEAAHFQNADGLTGPIVTL